MIGTYKNIFGGVWLMSHDTAMAHLPYVYSIISGKPMDVKLDTIPKEIISLSSLSDYNPQNTGSISRLYVNKHDYIGILKFHSAITKNDVFCGARGTQSMAVQVKQWLNDANCIGLIQDHDSGGGEALGTRQLARAIKEDFTKPTATFWRGTMASASAYLGCSSDRVFVDQDADVSGSIGVLASYMDILPALEKLGVVNHLILADGSEDKIKAHRDLLKKDYKLVKKESLNVIKEQFTSWMKSVRPGLSEEALTGKVYHPKKAIKIGLADEFGTFSSAYNYILDEHELNQEFNTNTNMAKEKTYPNLQSVLGLTNPLTLTKGFFASSSKIELTGKQVDLIEAALAKAGSDDNLKTELSDVKTQLQSANDKNESITSLVNESMETLDLEKSDDVEANIKTIVDATSEYGKQPGATHTKPDLSEQKKPEGNPEFAGLDLNNELYNEIK